jgi:aromatic-L-amino-acid decarboxylase
MSGTLLDPSPDEFRRMGNAAVDALADYLGSVRDRRVYPQTSAQAIRKKLESELPNEPVEFARLLEIFTEVIVPHSRQNAHPRMFGYVQSPGTAVAALADFLASTLNANLTAWRSAPAAVELERLTIDWIKQIIGYHADAAGLFVSGGSMANLAALVTARQAKLTTDKAVIPSASEGPHESTSDACEVLRFAQDDRSRAMRVYCSEETHHSIEKAAAILGIGWENVRKISVDAHFKIRIDDLVVQISEDIASGHQPFCVVANAGTVMTGAIDPLAQIAEVARRFNLWLHVDAAYGGFAVLSKSARSLFGAIREADSVSLDPHKWLYLPVDCGCVLYRDAQAARAAFAYEAEYTRVLTEQADEAFAFWDYGPELSRRFRALKVWMLLKGVGLRALGEAIEKDLACAGHFEQLVKATDDFEMLAPVELSIFCFRYVPSRLKRALASANETERVNIEQDLDTLNERLLTELQRDGSSYLSNARIRGRFALRGCVMNYRTTPQDMETLLNDLRRIAIDIERS